MRPLTPKYEIKSKRPAKPKPVSLFQGKNPLVEVSKSQNIPLKVIKTMDRPKSALVLPGKQDKKELHSLSKFHPEQNKQKLTSYSKPFQDKKKEEITLCFYVCERDAKKKITKRNLIYTEKTKLEKSNIAALLSRIGRVSDNNVMEKMKYIELKYDNPLVLFSMYQSLIYLIPERAKGNLSDQVFILSLPLCQYWRITPYFLISQSSVPMHRCLGACLFTEKPSIPDNRPKASLMTNFSTEVKPKYVRISLMLSNTSNLLQTIKWNFVPLFKKSEIETIEYSIYWDSFTVNNFVNYFYYLLLALSEISVNSIMHLKDIFIEIICQDNSFNPQKVKEFSAYFNLNRKKFGKLFRCYNIVMRFSHHDTQKKFIPCYIEKKLNYDKKTDCGYPLVYAKYSETSPMRKLHRFIYQRIFLFLIDFDYMRLPESKVKIIHTLKEAPKKVVKKK